MKQILLITSLYPADDIKFKNNTAVCHYFAKEWVKMGYLVRVLYLYNEYPLFMYPLLKLTKNILADKVDAAILSDRRHEVYNYTIDGVSVTRLPIFKYKPRGKFSETVLKKVINSIETIIRSEGFHPDYILGHFINPGIHVVSELKKLYPNAISTIALHGEEHTYKQKVQECLNNIDYVGYRSVPIKTAFETLYGNISYFMCMSGVPVQFVVEKKHSFKKGVNRFVFVGNFMKRKHPAALIPAISQVYKDEDYSITYVGDGNGINDINHEIDKYKVRDHVCFTGRIKREDVTRKMDESDVFVMISEKETFGLVYLEAMARGCITIASRNEGMEGIIIDGENGFLCNAGDSKELEQIVQKIKDLDISKIQEISRKAIETASNMTDVKMAQMYINSISK